MLIRTASMPILGVYQFSNHFMKCATGNNKRNITAEAYVKQAINFINKDVIKAVSKLYNISPNIEDYVFPVPRAVGADYPNSNGDCFTHSELTRYSNKHRCLVYQTFKNVPIHIEHKANNKKEARGFIPDAEYIQTDPKDKYVLTICAVDSKKDPALAEGLVSGDIRFFSMGCVCEAVECSICGNRFTNDRDLCQHLRPGRKMSYIGGKQAYEKCLGVSFQELSVVGDPAYNKAATQFILGKNNF